MLKHNGNGKIEKWSGEVIPTNDLEERWLKWFASLTAQERAQVVVMGREQLEREWQMRADEVTG